MDLNGSNGRRVALLDAARAGDEEAFRSLVEPYRRELHSHCYRMLGSSHDADDALQETMLRAWRGLPGFVEHSSLRSWLYTIATNASLRLIERRPKRVLPIEYARDNGGGDEGGLPLLESVWVEPYPDRSGVPSERDSAPEALYEERETLELAFVAALQHLPANQRAVLIMRDALGFSAAEVAQSLGTSVASVNSVLQRARRGIGERVSGPSQQATLRAIGDRGVRELVDRFTSAMARGDIEAVVAMLAADATWSMLAPSGERIHGPVTWYRGSAAIAAFLERGPLSGRWRWVRFPTAANGQPAVAGYTWDQASEGYRLRALDVLTLDGERIAAVTAFLDTNVLRRFGLPLELQAS